MMSFDVYCGRLPAPWYMTPGKSTLPLGGTVTIDYLGPGGAMIEAKEGAFCTTSASLCSPNVGVLETASFAGGTGNLDSVSGGGFAIYVDPGSTHGYTITGTNVAQSKFVGIAAAFVKVPKT